MDVRRRRKGHKSEPQGVLTTSDSRYKAEHTENAHPGIDTSGLHKQCRLIVWSGYQNARNETAVAIMKAVDKTREDFEDTSKPGHANPPLKPEGFRGRRKGHAFRKCSLPAPARRRKTSRAVEED